MSKYVYKNFGPCGNSDGVVKWEDGIEDITGEIVDTVAYNGCTVGVIVKVRGISN